MTHQYIKTDAELQTFCNELDDVATISFDTEFVSEDTYRPDLCLIQVAVADRIVLIDTQAISDIKPFWERLASPRHSSVAHAAREEFLFCYRSTARAPHDLVDLQVAAGLIGMEFPAAYGTLVSRLLGKTLGKGETRTDWRARPLTDRQIEYACQDVIYLEPLRDIILEKLDELGRMEWLREEMATRQEDLELYSNREQWRRVSGSAGLSTRSLTIVHELWRWREAQAEAVDKPARRILRDDLIVELARRKTADVKHIREIRGLQFRNVKSHLPEIAATIARALDMPAEKKAQRKSKDVSPHWTVLCQFLTTAVSSQARKANLAPSLVGTVQDIRELAAHRLGIASEETPAPKLARGWRAEVVGHLVEDLLAGRVSIRITDPLSDEPLTFSPAQE